MLQKQYRLPSRIRLQHPTIVRSPLFVLKLSPNDLPYSRFGFIVRKAIEKRATHRNRIRRVFRSCIEDMLEQIRGGYDMLFLFESGILEKNKELMYHELHALFTQRNLLK